MSFDLRRATPTRPSILLWVLAVLAVAFVTLAGFANAELWPVGPIDDTVAQRAYDISADNTVLLYVLDAAALAFGTIGTTIGLAVLLAFALYQRQGRIAWWIVASGATVLIGNALLKLVFRRERPAFTEPLNEIGGYAFPSGHAAAAGLFFTVTILITIVLTGRGWKRRALISVLSVLGVAVAASRVFLGVHWTSDTLAGLIVGVGLTLGLWVLIVSDTVRFPHELAMVTGTGGRRAAVVLNPIKVGDIDDFKARLTTVAAAAGWNEPLWFETTVEDPGHGQAAAALRSGADLVVAAGGDGTVRAVCEEAAQTGVAVGIVPMGTGNLLARNLGIPLNTRDALEVLFEGQDKAIDLGTYHTDSGIDTSFLVMAGLGMDAAIMTGVNDQLKEKVGWLAYFVSGVKAARFPAVKVQISVDDGEFRKFRARTVVIGNVGFLQGGIPLLPAARADDGQLDVVVIAPKRFIGWIAIVVRVIGRQKRTNDRLDRLTGTTVVIKAEKDLPMQLDGDPVGEGREITASIRSGVLLVRVPLAPPVTAPTRW